MSAESRQHALDFWFDFDNQTLFQRTPEIDDAIENSYGRIGLDLDGLVDEFRASYASGDHPVRFAARIKEGTAGFRSLAELQLGILVNHFPLLGESAQHAFEHFGEGVLYDTRRIIFTDHVIHMMDGSPTTWAGYHRWHSFIRAAIQSGADANLCRQILSWIALAWAIQSEVDPNLDDPDNPGIAPDRMEVLRARWLQAGDDFIDASFVHFRGPAPTAEEFPGLRRAGAAFAADGETELSGFARVQQILNDASGSGRPNHGGKRRFWNLPYAEFMALDKIYDVQVVADEGPDRGARSGLILALKGEPPFGPGGLPRMPLNRPAVAPADIEYIQGWIDCGCPE